jgi:hypothetical protein
VDLLRAEDVDRARRSEPRLLDVRRGIDRQPVHAAGTRHHAVEDHDDLPLRRVRQRPAGAEPARPALDLTRGDVLELALAEGRQQVVRITERASRTVDGLRWRSSAR